MIKELFYFTKQERKQLYILSIMMSGLIIFYIFSNEKTIDRKAHFTLVEAIEKAKVENKQTEIKATELVLTPFDPNKVSESQLNNMGLPKQGIKSLLNYRKLGGRIKDIKHFKKMYGFEYIENKLLTEVLIFPPKQVYTSPYPTDTKMDTIFSKSQIIDEPSKPFRKAKPSTAKVKIEININTTDTTELKTLYGIGSFRAKRIINFRNALGGFHDINQLYDTRYVPDSIITKHIDKFVIDTLSIHKIKLNEATQKELAQHPFISWQAAKVICNYRIEHGEYSDSPELFGLHGLDSALIVKILPYISFEY